VNASAPISRLSGGNGAVAGVCHFDDEWCAAGFDKFGGEISALCGRYSGGPSTMTGEK
jgi:hypothetical protein